MEFNLADLFEIVVDTVPERLALVAGDGAPHLPGLDGRANRVAQHLRSAGIGARRPRGDAGLEPSRVDRGPARQVHDVSLKHGSRLAELTLQRRFGNTR